MLFLDIYSRHLKRYNFSQRIQNSSEHLLLSDKFPGRFSSLTKNIEVPSHRVLCASDHFSFRPVDQFWYVHLGVAR